MGCFRAANLKRSLPGHGPGRAARWSGPPRSPSSSRPAAAAASRCAPPAAPPGPARGSSARAGAGGPRAWDVLRLESTTRPRLQAKCTADTAPQLPPPFPAGASGGPARLRAGRPLGPSVVSALSPRPPWPVAVTAAAGTLSDGLQGAAIYL